MKQRNTVTISKYGKTLYVGKSKRGWAIVIMPDEIRIDNYYKTPHMHFGADGIHIPIKYKELDEVGLILEIHLLKNKGLNTEKLKEELCYD